jgi:hypothetical protein
MYFGSSQPDMHFSLWKSDAHVMLLENSFLHVRDYKMHNVVGGSHMYLQHPFCIPIHTTICMCGLHFACLPHKLQQHLRCLQINVSVLKN